MIDIHYRIRGRILTVLIVAVAALAVGFGVGAAYEFGRSEHQAAQSKETADGGEATGNVAAEQTETKTLYTCGMHPEIVSNEPGNCPKCEMKLTPMDPDRAQVILEAQGQSVGDGGTQKKGKILYYRAPMDPTYIRNEPGKSPMGMDLVPVYESDVKGGPSIRIDPVTEQNMGLRYDVVRVGPVEKTIRTVGTVEYEEQSFGAVTTKVDGWVETVHVDQTGVQVHKGEPLFELYSPELVSTQEDYLVALRDLERARSQGNSAMTEMAQSRLRSTRQRLLFFDISDKQIETLEETKEIQKTLTITSQLTGIVIKKSIVEGDHLKAGTPAYRIADLSTIWVVGKVFESDMPFLRLGQEARMKLDYLPGRVYRGRLTYVYPYLEEGTREVPVRMEFHNPGYELKPGMYATIEIRSRLEDEAVLAPAMSIIDTGERQISFVSREPGKFEPRQVRTGVRTDTDEIQIFSGLAPGERIVVSGQFMLDSESRLREATLKMLQAGMTNTSEVMEESGSDLEHAGHAVMEMEQPPEAMAISTLKYVCPMPSHAGILHDEPGDCPLCGMDMVPVNSWQASASKIDHYTCPMPEHYDVEEEKPGKCPLCRMTLIPVTERDLERFQAAESKDAPRRLYTCPMPSHAHVVSNEPVRCPECEMKLVPTTSVEHGSESEALWRKEHGTTGTAQVLYTCPMESHAHIVSDEPGRCPECEMKLVPTSEVDHGPKSEALWQKEHGTTGTAQVLYTCPMHPDVQSSQPGRCPICEMALVPADEVSTGTEEGAPSTTGSAQVLYTCPMESHAHIVSDEPGKCPECEMTLVPTTEVEHGPKSEALWQDEQATTATTNTE